MGCCSDIRGLSNKELIGGLNCALDLMLPALDVLLPCIGQNYHIRLCFSRCIRKCSVLGVYWVSEYPSPWGFSYDPKKATAMSITFRVVSG